jgi:signal transduction histidine kinase
MNRLSFLYTFRGRLLVVLAVLLVATLGVQYYLNLRSEQTNAKRRERESKTLVAGITLGFNSISTNYRLNTLKTSQPFFGDYADRIEDILVIDNDWQISDSFNEDYLPAPNADGVKQYKNLADLHNLPPLQDVGSLGADRAKFPNASDSKKSDEQGEAHAIPVETEDGRWYVMVILKSEEGLAFARAAQTLIYPLAILLASTFLTAFLVWRFTRPIEKLSEAARRVAEGDLTVRVEGKKRPDEMGQLAVRFNEMTAELEKARLLAAQLQQAEKSAVVGRLGSAIAHEIRNPLNYINLTLDHLRVKFAPDDITKRETFERLTLQLKSEVARINRQITDFLSYSRPLKMKRQPTDVKRVVEDSMRIVVAQAAEQNVDTSIVVPDEIGLIVGDAEHLRSVFNNLFVNAVQAMHGGGNLTAIIEPAGDFVKVVVADTGEGIAPENLNKIFEPYFSTKETGTGLGLAIVKKIVDDHNGTITIKSKLNEGTTFEVKLPQAL